MNMQNDGGIKRGDRADTGPEQARRKPGVGIHGSGLPGGDGGATGHVTAEADSLAEPVDRAMVDSQEVVDQAEDLEDLYITGADDPTLGLTDIDDVPAEDWAADTGPTRTAEEVDKVVPAPDDRNIPLNTRPNAARKRKPRP